MFKYKYNLVRSSRRTISVQVKKNNVIEVKAPTRVSVERIEQFLNEKIKWIERVIAKNNAENEVLKDVISYKKVLVKGVEYSLVKGKSSYISEGEVCVKSISDLRNLLITHLGERFARIFEDIRAKNSFICTKVCFKDYKARWGSCSAGKEIVFNYRLLMLPERLWIYVIVHELCHTVYMNHSENFYNLVGSIMPDYKQAKAELKAYDRLTRLY